MSEATMRGAGAPQPASVVRVAEQAAAAVGVRVELIQDLDGIREVAGLLAAIWSRPDGQGPINEETMRALSHGGNYVAAAYDDRRILGACVGFFAAPEERMLHSHVAGVVPQARGRSVGMAMKLHQRAWAAGQGLVAINWTFDPLVSRNAYFNIGKLGGHAVEYLPNFYGEMSDGINAGLDSDRLLIRWSTLERTTPARRPAPARFALAVGASGEPVLHKQALLDRSFRVAIPCDVEQLRAHDPRLAQVWRTALRDVLAPLMDVAVVSGFDRAGWYLLRRR